MSKLRLLDLFCGAGGAAMGYHWAGFEVVGVDIKPQPRYPFEFHQGDAMTWPLEGFAAIHASPPCQRWSVMSALPKAREHPDLIAPIRERLGMSGVHWVIENVPNSPLRSPIMLCGSMFGLRSTEERYLRRHRLFELSWPVVLVPQCQHSGLAVGVYGHGSAGWPGQRMRTAKAPEAQLLMGINWMTRDGMSQAIPPAYTEWIGKQLMEYLRSDGLSTPGRAQVKMEPVSRPCPTV